MALKLALLGRPVIALDGQPLAALRSDKARGILFYLAATGHSQTRAHLAELFWPSNPHAMQSARARSSSEDRARANLRHEIKTLNSLLAPYLMIEHDSIDLNADAGAEVDTALFMSQFPSQGKATLHQLQAATALYRGSFLEQFYVRGAPDFEQWAAQQSAFFEVKVFDALRTLSRHYADIGDIGRSLQYIDSWLSLAPTLEEAHHCKMILLALNGDSRRAADHYRRFAGLLADDEDAKQLYDLILREKIASPDLDFYLPPLPAPLVSLQQDRNRSQPFQAPPLLDYFVGRSRELDEIKQLLQPPRRSSIFAIVGMGGVGKSSLAARLAHELRYLAEDGVLWADLAQSEPMSVLEGWGSAYGADHLARCRDIGTRAAAFRDLMADKQALIILDDVQGANQVEPLRPNSAGSIVLMTTRDRELAASVHAHMVALRGLKRSDSIQLLISVIGRERVEAERAAAETIAALLEDLPLAVEITAQQINANPDRAVADTADELRRVHNRLIKLKTRNRAVRTSFERSWELLDNHLRRVFASLAVFRERSFPLEAAIYAAELGEDEDSVLALWRISLLFREGKGRYRLHALLADYAREKLGDNPIPYDRLADYYLAYVRARRAVFPDLDREWSNITAAVRIAYDHGRWSLVADYARALEDAWFVLGRFSDARLVYGWLCEMELTANQEGLLERARVLCQWGLVCIEQSDYQEAEARINDGLEIYEELTYVPGVATAKYLLGRAVIEREQFGVAEPLLRESLRIRQALGDDIGVADVLYLLADIPFAAANYPEARSIGEQALEHYRRADYSVGAIKGLGLMADIALCEQDYALTKQYCAEALEICDTIHEQAERALILYILAEACKQQADYDRALEAAEQSIKLLRDMGDRKLLTKALWRKATIYGRMAQPDLAAYTCDECLQIARSLGEDAYRTWSVLCDELRQKYGIPTGKG